MDKQQLKVRKIGWYRTIGQDGHTGKCSKSNSPLHQLTKTYQNQYLKKAYENPQHFKNYFWWSKIWKPWKKIIGYFNRILWFFVKIVSGMGSGVNRWSTTRATKYYEDRYNMNCTIWSKELCFSHPCHQLM